MAANAATLVVPAAAPGHVKREEQDVVDLCGSSSDDGSDDDGDGGGGDGCTVGVPPAWLAAPDAVACPGSIAAAAGAPAVAAVAAPSSGPVLALLPPSYNTVRGMEQQLQCLLTHLQPCLQPGQFGGLAKQLQAALRPLRDVAAGDERLRDVDMEYFYLQAAVASGQLQEAVSALEQLLESARKVAP